MHNNIGEDIDTRRGTIVKWKIKMAVYTDDNTRICKRKVEYIHVPFSTIHDAYIYVIRIANTLRKSVTILSKDINLRNLNSLKFKPRFLNASLRFEKRKKKKYLRTFYVDIYPALYTRETSVLNSRRDVPAWREPARNKQTKTNTDTSRFR